MERLTVDRLISGAGAIAAGADDFSRGFGESEPRLLGRRPGAVPVAIVLLVLAGLLLFVGIETTDPPNAPDLRAGDLARDDGLGQQTYATVSGWLASTFVGGTEDEHAAGEPWFYLLVDPTARRGITVRSERPPSKAFTSRLRGVIVEDPEYVADDIEYFKADTEALGLTLEPKVYIDASDTSAEPVQPLDLGAPAPADGTTVEISGSRLVDYLGVCLDGAANEECETSDADAFDVIVYDPVSKHAITVLTRTSPAFTETTLSGMLSRNERAVEDAEGSGTVDVGDLRLEVSPHYVLDEGTTPPDTILAFLLAGALTMLGGAILIGSVGGYVVFRGIPSPLPEPRTTLGPGERLPLRVTGFIHTPYGRVHVREAPAYLVRFVVRPFVASTELGAPDTPATTTLLIERTGYAHGISIGLGELARLSAGEATPFRGSRPALRAVAGTGPLLLTFDTVADRDRAAAELLDESGLGRDGLASLAGAVAAPA
jgi:hypothetical protein